MNNNFKLNTIPYNRFTIEEFEKEGNKILNELKNSSSGNEQFMVHKKYYKLIKQMYTTKILVQLRHDSNVTDKFFEKEQDYYDEISPKIESFEIRYKKELYNSKYRDFLENKIGNIAFKDIDFSIKSFSDSIIPLMQEENALISKYSKLIAEIKINFKGQILNLSLLSKYKTSKDRNIRIEATKARNKAMLEIQEQFDYIYDKLVKNRTKQANLMGYKNYVELGYYRMGRTTYTINDIRKFRENIKKYIVPFTSELHEKRRKRLNITKLDAVDEGIYFLEGNPSPKGSSDDIFKAGQKMYNELSKETSEFFNFMLDHQLFDVLGTKNKAPGGYMDMLYTYKAPIIFANFNGTQDDVNVITHESGHAFQGYLTRDDEIMEHNNIKMETAETHSMSMEFFADKWAELFFKDSADNYRKLHFEDSVNFIPYGCMVDEFQEIIYLNPELSPIERRNVWKDLTKKYKPYLTFEYDSFYKDGRRWQLQSHIYMCPFYYIDYVIAEICALQFKIKMDQNYQDAWSKYLDFCKESAKDSIENMLHNVGLKSPFDEDCIKNTVNTLKTKY